MKKAFQWANLLLVAFFFAAIVTFLATRTGLAANGDDCVAGAGAWTPDGGSSDFGTCVYPPNTPESISSCGADHEYTFIFFSSEATQDFCTFVAPLSTGTGSGSGESGGCRTEVRGPLEAPVTLALCHGKNGAATFPTGDCALKCTITSALPAGAARKLPKNTVATMYVRTVGSGGEASNDPYSVCFRTTDLGLTPPTIYRFIGGQWVVVAIGNPDSSLVCTAGSGEGSYALGEPGKKE